jgi:hypothetical protein
VKARLLPSLLLAGIAGGVLGASYGLRAAPQAEPLYLATASRADCLEVRLAPSDDGSRLVVRAWLWDGDGQVRWTRDLELREPLSVLFDATAEGQEAVDLSHWYAERMVEAEDGTLVSESFYGN